MACHINKNYFHGQRFIILQKYTKNIKIRWNICCKQIKKKPNIVVFPEEYEVGDSGLCLKHYTGITLRTHEIKKRK